MLISKRLFRGARAVQIFRQPAQCRMFSAEDAPQDEKASVPEPTQAEKDAHKHEWGIKYNDECLKFEKEWELIASKVENEQMVYLESELGDLQKEKVNMLADKVINLNLYEIRYFHALIAKKSMQATGLSPMKLNLDWPSLKQDATGTWPPANPNWFK